MQESEFRADFFFLNLFGFDIRVGQVGRQGEAAESAKGEARHGLEGLGRLVGASGEIGLAGGKRGGITCDRISSSDLEIVERIAVLHGRDQVADNQRSVDVVVRDPAIFFGKAGVDIRTVGTMEIEQFVITNGTIPEEA